MSACDDSDDDDYFNKLQEFANSKSANEDDNAMDSVYVTEPIVFESDEEYYESMSNASAMSAVCIIPENDMVWQHMARSHFLLANNNLNWHTINLIEDLNEHAASFLLIEQWLFSYLPYSSKVFVMLRNRKLHHLYLSSSYLCVDDIHHPSLAMIASKVQGNSSYISCTVFSTPSVPTNVIVTACQTLCQFNNDNVIDDFKQLRIGANKHVCSGTCGVELDAVNDTVLNTFICTLINDYQMTEKQRCTYGLFVNFSPTSLSSSDYAQLTEGYYFDDLRDEDVIQIYESWTTHHTDRTTLQMVKAMIRYFPCIGIRHGGCLVCWCLTYPYGAIGMLQTVKGHSHQALAQAVVTKLITRWLSHNTGCLPFTYISSDNNNNNSDDDATIHLFTSLGFTRIADQSCGLLQVY